MEEYYDEDDPVQALREMYGAYIHPRPTKPVYSKYYFLNSKIFQTNNLQATCPKTIKR